MLCKKGEREIKLDSKSIREIIQQIFLSVSKFITVLSPCNESAMDQTSFRWKEIIIITWSAVINTSSRNLHYKEIFILTDVILKRKSWNPESKKGGKNKWKSINQGKIKTWQRQQKKIIPTEKGGGRITTDTKKQQKTGETHTKRRNIITYITGDQGAEFTMISLNFRQVHWSR